MMTDRLVSEAPMAADAARVRRFKRYKAYENSGVEWLREIPVHWVFRRTLPRNVVAM